MLTNDQSFGKDSATLLHLTDTAAMVHKSVSDQENPNYLNTEAIRLLTAFGGREIRWHEGVCGTESPLGNAEVG